MSVAAARPLISVRRRLLRLLALGSLALLLSVAAVAWLESEFVRRAARLADLHLQSMTIAQDARGLVDALVVEALGNARGTATDPSAEERARERRHDVEGIARIVARLIEIQRSARWTAADATVARLAHDVDRLRAGSGEGAAEAVQLATVRLRLLQLHRLHDIEVHASLRAAADRRRIVSFALLPALALVFATGGAVFARAWRAIGRSLQAEQALRDSVERSEARLRFLLEASPAGIYTCETSGDYAATFMSANAVGLTGFTPDEFLKDPGLWVSRLHPDDVQRATAGLTGLFESGRHFHEYRFRHKDGRYRWMRDELHLVRDKAGRPLEIVGSWFDTTERREAEEALRTAAAHLRKVQEIARMGDWEWDVKADVAVVSESLLRLFGRVDAPSWASYEAFRALVHPDDAPRQAEALQRALRGEAEYDLVYRLVRPDGGVWHTHARAEVIRDADGTPLRMVGMQQDITEIVLTQERLQAALREKDVLLKEIYHRVKNNLQVVSSLLRLQGRSARHPAARDLLDESADRIRAMALVHEQLYQTTDLGSIDFATYARSLAQHVARTHGEASLRAPVRTESDPVRLRPDAAIPLGLIVNELLSNAYKHAFPADRRGEVLLQLRAAPPGELELVVADDGVGLPGGLDPASSDSLGMQLVVSLTRQLEGALAHGPNVAAGTRFTVRFPWRPPEPEPAPEAG